MPVVAIIIDKIVVRICNYNDILFIHIAGVKPVVRHKGFIIWNDDGI